MKGIKSLVASIMAIFMCVTTLVGSTFAWFTDSVSSEGNKIVSGTLKVDLELLNEDGTWKSLKDDTQAIFNYSNWEPGYTDIKVLKVENEGSLALKWKAMFVAESELSILADVIDVYVLPSENELTYPENRNLEGYTQVGTVREFVSTIESTTKGELASGEVAYLGIALRMQNVGNEYQGLDLCGAFDIVIVATQMTVEEDGFNDQYDNDAEYPSLPDKWNGTASIAWFLDDPSATVFTLSTAEDLAGLGAIIDGTATMPTNDLDITLPVTFEGKTIKLESDVDLQAFKVDENGEQILDEYGNPILMCFQPIGSYRNENAFKGTFDGQGHTIFNMSQNTWELDTGYYYGDLGLGLFGLVEDATITNLTIDNASISGESAICGTVAATAYGNCTFENITVKNTKCNDYQYYAGGVVGWASGTQTYKNIVIDESTVIGGQWGDFGNANGGIIGGIGSSAEILFEDCTIACRIDAVNDIVSAYQWYCYRNCGMLIGKVPQTITAGEVQTVKTPEKVTCKNVTVIYGDWANYTYCEFAGTGYPYVRVQAGVSVDAYTNVRYGHPTDANGNTVVDDNHVHNDGEAHHELIVFDQLFGGPADHRYCYYGIAEFDGVTVIYNNK